MNRRLTPLALAAAVAGTNLGHAVAGSGELLRGGPSQAAPAPGDQDGRHGTTIVVRGRPGLTARPEATQHEHHPDRQRCDRRAVDEPGLTRLARDTVDGESLTFKEDGRRPILVPAAAHTRPLVGAPWRAVSLNEAPSRLAEAQGPGARLQVEAQTGSRPHHQSVSASQRSSLRRRPAADRSRAGTPGRNRVSRRARS